MTKDPRGPLRLLEMKGPPDQQQGGQQISLDLLNTAKPQGSLISMGEVQPLIVRYPGPNLIQTSFTSLWPKGVGGSSERESQVDKISRGPRTQHQGKVTILQTLIV